MPNDSSFTLITVPARIADLEFSYRRPDEFRVVEVPTEKPDFENPTAFYPLHMVIANAGAALFSVVARPAFDNGSVLDWAELLAERESISVVSMKPGVLGGMPAVFVEAMNQTDAGITRMRTALLEDGKRLLNLAIMAPDAIWKSVEPTLHTMMTSFRLAEPRGATAPLTPSDLGLNNATPLASSSVPHVSAKESRSLAGIGERGPESPANLALAETPATLDPEHPFNIRLRNDCLGLTPRVLGVNAAEKYALVGADAIAATVKVPFGWHVLDDGRRTLVMDAARTIEISLTLGRNGGDPRGMLEAIETEARGEQPGIDPVQVNFAADLPGLVLRDYRDQNVLVHAFVVRTFRDDGSAHVARVTAATGDMSRAVNLVAFILRSASPVMAAAVQRSLSSRV